MSCSLSLQCALSVSMVIDIIDSQLYFEEITEFSEYTCDADNFMF